MAYTPRRRSVVKTSLYFPEIVLAEIQAEADRLDRPLSWVLEQAWNLAMPTVKTFPGIDELYRKAMS